jgi:multimeric flavodoxin WrbA
VSPAEPRVLCIAGSPRRHGNSDRLLDALAKGVVDAGGVPVRLTVADAGISPCRGCNACSATGECRVRDGMDDVYRLLDTADAVAVASPVYFATVPAVFKVAIDRFQPYWARRYVLREPQPEKRRPGAVLLVGGGGDPYGTGCALTPVTSAFAVINVDVAHVLEVVGPDAPSDIEGFADELLQATEIGRRLVESAIAAR